MINKNLHTEALEARYGPIQAVVLRHDSLDHDGERIREAKLVDQNGILRTYALTFLSDNNESEEFFAIDKKIKEGALMGQTFIAYGYKVIRTVLCDIALPLPVWMQNEFQVQQTVANAKLIEFRARKQRRTFTYGTLLEIYSPDFENPRELDCQCNDRALPSGLSRTLYDRIMNYLEVHAI